MNKMKVVVLSVLVALILGIPNILLASAPTSVYPRKFDNLSLI